MLRLITKIIIYTTAILMFTVAAKAQSNTESVDQIHQELRSLKKSAEDAINERDSEALFRLFTDNVILTAFNQDNVHGINAAKDYFAKMMVGSERFIIDMSISSETDDRSQLYADNTMAIAAGTAEAYFKLKTGNEFHIPLRWTAVVNYSDGGWKFAAMHFSANPVDNPLAGAAATFWKWIAIGLAVLGLLIGLFIGRKTRKAA